MSFRKIIIAPDSFKGTLTSIQVCNIIEEAIHNIEGDIETKKIPIADGGEGTVECFLHALGGEKVFLKAKDPLFQEIEAYYGILEDKKTAVIEMSTASGLPLIEDKKNPLKATTYGTGQMIQHALNQGCTKIILGIGGSATNDGGVGMAAALGAKFYDQEENEIPLNGEGLEYLKKIDLSHLDKRLYKCEVIVACDVNNPLYGPNGAAYIYGPQKGADDQMVEQLDSNLKHFASIIQAQLNMEVQDIPGAGAAGGLGAGLVAFAGAELKPGIDIVFDTVNFSKTIKDADLIITGEGKIDGQSLNGKVPVGVGRIAKELKKPVIAIVGSIGDDLNAIYENGISAIFSINRNPVDFQYSRHHSEENLLKTTEDLIRFYLSIDSLG